MRVVKVLSLLCNSTGAMAHSTDNSTRRLGRQWVVAASGPGVGDRGRGRAGVGEGRQDRFVGQLRRHGVAPWRKARVWVQHRREWTNPLFTPGSEKGRSPVGRTWCQEMSACASGVRARKQAGRWTGTTARMGPVAEARESR
jgi:hypothetical protein